jgi:hypothetical protein
MYGQQNSFTILIQFDVRSKEHFVSISELHNVRRQAYKTAGWLTNADICALLRESDLVLPAPSFNDIQLLQQYIYWQWIYVE